MIVRDFAPLTFRGALVKAAPSALRALYAGDWSEGLGKARFENASTLAVAFRHLDPITDYPMRTVALHTRARGWLAVYTNAGEDDILVGLGMRFGTCVTFHCMPATPHSEPHFQFVHYVRTDFSEAGLHRAKERTVQLYRHRSKWRFAQSGPRLRFERTAAYRHAKIAKRFSPSLLFEYLDKLGFQPLEDDFFVIDKQHPALLVAYPIAPPDYVNEDGSPARWKRQARWIAEADWNAALAAQW